MKDLSTCALAIALVASVCALHEDSWKLKFESLLLLGLWTLEGVVVIWEPPIELRVCTSRTL